MRLNGTAPRLELPVETWRRSKTTADLQKYLDLRLARPLYRVEAARMRRAWASVALGFGLALVCGLCIAGAWSLAGLVMGGVR